MTQSSQQELNNLPESDLELLSAYLDNQLSVAERVGLERRLEAEPRLRAEMDELRATAALLRGLEPARPPRSFTLDPATALRRGPRFSLAWAMQLGSGLAGLALVLLASVQILAGSLATSALPAPAAEPAPMQAMEAPAPQATAAPASAAREADLEPTAAGSAAFESAPMMATAAPATAAAATGGATGGAANDEVSSEINDGLADEPYLSDPPQAQAPKEPAPSQGGFGPGITMSIGLALLLLAVGWRIYARR